MSQMTFDFSDLKSQLAAYGIGGGDMVYVASDVTRLLYMAQQDFDLDLAQGMDAFLGALIDALQVVVTEQGTLLLPAYTWAFCRGKAFDVRRTKSEVGVLNNWVLKHRPDFQRTQHPIYSFLVWGKYAPEFLRMKNTDAWGSDSPFAFLRQHSSKVLLLDVTPCQAFTFMHYVEETLHVPYRYLKKFRSTYIDASGNSTTRDYTMFVRDLDILSQQTLPDAFFESSGAMKTFDWHGLPLRVIDVPRACDLLEDDLLHHGGHNCYAFENYALDWSKPQTHPDDLDR